MHLCCVVDTEDRATQRRYWWNDWLPSLTIICLILDSVSLCLFDFVSHDWPNRTFCLPQVIQGPLSAWPQLPVLTSTESPPLPCPTLSPIVLLRFSWQLTSLCSIVFPLPLQLHNAESKHFLTHYPLLTCWCVTLFFCGRCVCSAPVPLPVQTALAENATKPSLIWQIERRFYRLDQWIHLYWSWVLSKGEFFVDAHSWCSSDCSEQLC